MTAFTEPTGQLITGPAYDALPESSWRELVDGTVHVAAAPTAWHQIVRAELMVALKGLAPDQFRVTGGVEVRLGELLRRNPDAVVVHAVGLDRMCPRLRPDQVVLAVEVVSPGSESTDRILKPVEYAKVGIQHFWRVEIEPEIVINTYRLAPTQTGVDRAYLRTGIFGPGETVRAPGLLWATVNVDDLADEQ